MRTTGADALADEPASAGDLDAELEQIAAQSSDPLHLLLANQAHMMQQLLPRPVDAITAALRGASANESASSSGAGVKGRNAREAYLKQLENHEEVARCQELGLETADASIPPGLMREFLEKRMAVSDHRSLACFATFLAHGWQEARLARNVHLEAFCAKGMMAVEQWVLDGGRPTVAWLFAGYSEPMWNMFGRQQRASSLENRLQTSRDMGNRPPATGGGEADIDTAPGSKGKARWKAKAKPKAGHQEQTA